ncbi:unnamed protein product [Closterium sp. NIES-54]
MATHLQPSFAASHVSSAVPLHTSPPQVCAFPLTFPRIPPASAVRIPSPCALSCVLFRGAPSPTRIRSPPKRAAAARAAAKGESPASGGDPALAAAAWKALVAVRTSRPLVHCITNFVSMDAAANTLLAAGAAPAMVHSLEEVEEFASLASALYVNIGTLSPDWVDSMKRAAKVISARNRPWVLDPVGCGATSYRTKTSAELLALRPTVVRGNASEVLALAGAVSANTRGVDSTVASTAAVAAAQQLAAEWNTVVAVSGATDFITDGRTVLACDNGVPLLQAITATGCSVTALITAFVAAAVDTPPAPASGVSVLPPLLATACALAFYGVTALIAAFLAAAAAAAAAAADVSLPLLASACALDVYG